MQVAALIVPKTPRAKRRGSRILKAEYKNFVAKIAGQSSLTAARAMATDVFMAKNAPDKLEYIMLGAINNPLFVPELPAALNPASLMSVGQLQKTIGFARAAAANTRTPRVLFTAPPKSGSTFVSAMIARTLGLRRATLTLNSALPYAHAVFGGATNEQAIDESALLTNCLMPVGFVAHHHMLCSPLMANQLKIYAVKPVLASRNIFDCLVSYDEHFLKVIANSDGKVVIRYGLPTDYLQRDFDDRIAVLIDLKLDWYFKYYLSWLACEREGYVKPLWISYENDILGPKELLAGRLRRFFDLPEEYVSTFTAALSEQGGAILNVNKGVSGRGSAITGKNRERITDFFHRYSSEADFSFILD